MNDHAGWTQDLKCVLCGSDDAAKPCAGLPTIDELQDKVALLKRELALMTEERDWWMKKHQQDVQSMRYIARKEGAHEMQNKIRDLVWGIRLDEFLDSEIRSLEYEEEHKINCSWWRDWHDCSCEAFEKKS
jgi:hypothetical protein